MRAETIARLATAAIAALEKDGLRAIARYSRTGPRAPLRHNGERYQGGNAFALYFAREPREDHAPYLAHWLKVLKSDPRLIWTAAAAAERAADFLHAMQPAPAAAAAA